MIASTPDVVAALRRHQVCLASRVYRECGDERACQEGALSHCSPCVCRDECMIPSFLVGGVGLLDSDTTDSRETYLQMTNWYGPNVPVSISSAS